VATAPPRIAALDQERLPAQLPQRLPRLGVHTSTLHVLIWDAQTQPQGIGSWRTAALVQRVDKRADEEIDEAWVGQALGSGANRQCLATRRVGLVEPEPLAPDGVAQYAVGDSALARANGCGRRVDRIEA
jgi:hypothetical protein